MIVATVFLITIILGIINHLYNFVIRAENENQTRVNRVDKVVKNEIKIKNYSINDGDYQHPLRDYYILSSMNSCMNGGSMDGAEMNTSALRDSIRLGCRFLDFEIYQKNGQPVIAVGEYQNRQRWTSTNTLNFEYVMTEINKMALGGSISSPNYADPIILSFRIKTLQNNIYNIMAETLKKTFGKKLLNNKEITKKYDNLSNVPLHKLKNKVIIYCNNMNGNDKNFKDTDFESLVNISEHSNLSSTYNQIVSYSEVTGVRDAGNLEWANILNSCKQNICLVFSHNEDLTNADINKKPFRENGVQISPINITSIKDDVNESPAKEHWDFFNKQRSAFVLKDEELRYKPRILPADKIPKQDPKVSFKTRKVKTSLGHNFDM